MTRPKILLFLLATTGLTLGILCGRALHGDSPHVEAKAGTAPAKKGDRVREAGTPVEEDATPPAPEGVPVEGFVVPREAMRRISVELMSGSSLNKNECRLLGLTETQIRELDLMVNDAVKRWREREMTAARQIPSAKGDILWHIPAARPELAEQEWQSLTNRLVEIGGPALEPLLTYRLTQGYSPSHQSNAGTGMLNLLTAGFGTLDRFIKIPADGSYASVTDVFPHQVKDVPVNESIFDQFGRRLNIDWRVHIPPTEHQDRFSHLPSTK